MNIFVDARGSIKRTIEAYISKRGHTLVADVAQAAVVFVDSVAKAQKYTNSRCVMVARGSTVVEAIRGEAAGHLVTWFRVDDSGVTRRIDNILATLRDKGD